MWAGLFEADFECVAARDIHLDWRKRVGEQVVDEGAGDHAGAAGEGLVLDATLVSADADVAGAEDGGEVGVGAGGGEGVVAADRAAVGEDSRLLADLLDITP